MDQGSELAGGVERLVAEQEMHLAKKDALIYDKRFQDLERQDPRFKVAIDLDGVLTEDVDEGLDDTLTLRPGVVEFLQEMRQHKDKIKLILWTSSIGTRTKKVLKQLDLQEYFELVINRENYDLVTLLAKEKIDENREKFPEIVAFQEKYERGKPLGTLGYQVLLDNTHSQRAAEENGFILESIPSFAHNPTERSPFPSGIASKLIAQA